MIVELAGRDRKARRLADGALKYFPAIAFPKPLLHALFEAVRSNTIPWEPFSKAVEAGGGWLRVGRHCRRRRSPQFKREIDGWAPSQPPADRIISPLEQTFVDQLVAAYLFDPDSFERLGLTASSPAWRLKHAGFSVAYAYSQQSPPRYKTAEGKVLDTIERRETAFKLGDSIVGTGLAAVPVAGGLLSEGYQEVKENMEALGGMANKGASAIVAGAKGAGRAIVKVFTRNAPEPREAVTAEGSPLQ